MAALARSSHLSFQGPRRSRGRDVPASPDPWSRPARMLPELVHARGARCWSRDGDLYVDFDNRDGAVLLGHADVEVAVAMRRADRTPVEMLMAALDERLAAMVPNAEATAYGPDFSAGLAAALATTRAATGRPLVFAADSCAWRDVSGLPSYPFNDLPALDSLLADKGHRTAALVLAPMGAAPGYLAGVRRLADAHGALLIFDEALSGFRIHEGGAQALYGVRADLTVFGDSLANGVSFTAVCGRSDLVEAAFAGEAQPQALAAAAAVLDKIDAQGVPTCLRVRGAEVQAEVSAAIIAAGAGDLVAVTGDPALSSLAFTPCNGVDALALRRFWVREAAERRLISLAAHTLSYAHGDTEIEALIAASGQIAERLVEAVHATSPIRPAARPYLTVQ